MFYITLPQSAQYRNISLDDLLDGKTSRVVRRNESNTRTYCLENLQQGKHYGYPWAERRRIIQLLKGFTQNFNDLYTVDRHSLYRTFRIPKRTGGWREINAPEPRLMDALYVLRSILEENCNALYHTAAFAYIKNRTTIDAVKRHQVNNSYWFLKVDFHDFFGSTTKEFVLKMLSQIVPFNFILDEDPEALSKALDLCFLDGRLPQGTPISPMLTNLIMIPIDFHLSKELREVQDGDAKYSCVYTRYADDLLISSLQGFNPEKVREIIRKVLAQFDAPYTFKEEKTRYGSREGSNWNLGVMLNKDNNITVGHRTKKTFRAMLTNYILDKKSGKSWKLEDVQYMNGLLSYYKMVEADYFERLMQKMNEKHGIDLAKMIKQDLTV